MSNKGEKLIDEINIGVIRTDCPPWNTPSDDKQVWWAQMVEDQCDGYGETAAQAIGNLMLEIVRCYEGDVMPYIKSIVVQDGKDKHFIGC